MKKKSLIVCYSYSGNTWKVAEEIRRQTGAPLCEIYTRQPYSMLFESLLTQVQKEIDTGCWPSLFPLQEHVEEYEAVFVGTPTWCGTVAPPLAAFLKANNLKGRLLFPFYTHCGKGNGTVEQDICRLCPGAITGESLAVLKSGGDSLSEQVDTWIKKIAENR